MTTLRACPTCHTPVTVKADGDLYTHRAGSVPCPGTTPETELRWDGEWVRDGLILRPVGR